jgi:hypothetical protein
MPSEIGPDLAFRPPSQQPGEIVFAEVQRQFPQILAIKRQDIEGMELDLVVMFPRVQPVEIGVPSTPSSTASPSMTNEVCRCTHDKRAGVWT